MAKTTIRTSLPFYLYLEDGSYNVRYGETGLTLTIQKQIVQPSRRTQSRSGNTVVRQDRWGIDEYSAIKIEVDRDFEDQESARDFSVKVINYVIDVYRYFDRAVHVVNITDEDIFEFNVFDESGSGSSGISFPGGLILGNTNELCILSEKVRNALKTGFQPPLYEMLLLNAQHYLFAGEYRVAIVESVIALESVVSSFLRTRLSERGITHSQIKEYLKELGISRTITITLKLFLQESDLQPSTLLSDCKGAISIRNRIIHEGETNVDKSHAEAAVDSITKLIRVLLQDHSAEHE